jgi:hypothetical protein
MKLDHTSRIKLRLRMRLELYLQCLSDSALQLGTWSVLPLETYNLGTAVAFAGRQRKTKEVCVANAGRRTFRILTDIYRALLQLKNVEEVP